MGRASHHAQSAGAGMSDDKKDATRVVSAGRREEWTQGIVNPAVWPDYVRRFERAFGFAPK